MSNREPRCTVRSLMGGTIMDEGVEETFERGTSAPPHPLDKMWFLKSKEKTYGPFSGHRMKEYLEQGRINGTTSIVQQGETEWVDLETVPELKRFVKLPEPPPFPRPLHLPPHQPSAHSRQKVVIARVLPNDEGQPAGFWVRAGAYVIDTLVLTPPHLMLAGITDTIIRSNFSSGWSFNLLIFAMWATYEISMNSGSWQATVGKRLCGIRITQGDGSGIDQEKAAIRFLCGILSAIPLGFGFIMAGFTYEKRALHDILCDTKVVFGKAD